MATGVNVGNGTIELTGIAADWSLASSPDKTAHLNRLGNGILISYIRFKAAAISNKLVVKDTNASGAVIAQLQAAATNDNLVAEIFAWKRPYIDYSECTLGAGAEVWIDYL